MSTSCKGCQKHSMESQRRIGSEHQHRVYIALVQIFFLDNHTDSVIGHVILMSAVIDPYEVTGLELNH